MKKFCIICFQIYNINITIIRQLQDAAWNGPYYRKHTYKIVAK